MNRNCDLCMRDIALVDRKTIRGYWAYMCKACNYEYGMGPQTILANVKE
jgi:hypothetical protein